MHGQAGGATLLSTITTVEQVDIMSDPNKPDAKTKIITEVKGQQAPQPANTDNLRVIVQLCDPADIAHCKTSDLFAATDAIPTEKTIDIFVDDSTPVLVARFTQSTTPMPICTDLTLTFADTPDAHVALSGDPAGDVTGCETCSIQACVQ